MNKTFIEHIAIAIHRLSALDHFFSGLLALYAYTMLLHIYTNSSTIFGSLPPTQLNEQKLYLAIDN